MLCQARCAHQLHRAAAAQACEAMNADNGAAWPLLQLDLLFDAGLRGQAVARPHCTYTPRPDAAETCHRLLRRATLLLSKVCSPRPTPLSARHACLSTAYPFRPSTSQCRQLLLTA